MWPIAFLMICFAVVLAVAIGDRKPDGRQVITVTIECPSAMPVPECRAISDAATEAARLKVGR